MIATLLQKCHPLKKSGRIMFKSIIICFVVLFSISSSHAQSRKEILVSAAASLRDAFLELGKNFEKDHAVKVVFNFAASGQLKTQIETGAPVDVFASASPVDMDALEKNNFLLEKTRKDFAKNELVLVQNIAAKYSVKTLSDLSNDKIKRIALGNPQSVPAGRYAKEYLENEKVYDAFKTKMIFGENVRQVLDYVQLGEVDAGFVFSTDAISSNKVQVVLKVPFEKHAPIIYPIAAIKNSKNSKEALDFVAFITSDKSQAVLKKFGFQKP